MWCALLVGSLLPRAASWEPSQGVRWELLFARGFAGLSDVRRPSAFFFISLHSVFHLPKENCSCVTVALSLKWEKKEGNVALKWCCMWGA